MTHFLKVLLEVEGTPTDVDPEEVTRKTWAWLIESDEDKEIKNTMRKLTKCY